MNAPFDVLLLREEALEDALLAEDVPLLATKRIDEGLEAEAACVKGLDGILAEPLPLRAVSELPLLLVREEGEIVVVLRVTLRHPCSLPLRSNGPAAVTLTLDRSRRDNRYDDADLERRRESND